MMDERQVYLVDAKSSKENWVSEGSIEVGRKGVWVPFIESEGSAGWALGVGCVGRGVSAQEREGKKSMVRKGDGGNKEVTNKGE
jgi:hypothetical protein